MASGLLLALGVADLAVLNLLLAPRLSEPSLRPLAERVAEARPRPPTETAPSPSATPIPCAPVAPVGAATAGPTDARAVEAVPDVLFELGEVQVPGGRAADVKQVAGALSADKGRRLVLRGHTDPVGTPESNLKLSRQRAESVLRLLRAFGAPLEQVSVEAVGNADPASTSDTPLGWARDRRVQLLWR
jgi:OOP family OmpA-OmpF porin